MLVFSVVVVGLIVVVVGLMVVVVGFTVVVVDLMVVVGLMVVVVGFTVVVVTGLIVVVVGRVVGTVDGIWVVEVPVVGLTVTPAIVCVEVGVSVPSWSGMLPCPSRLIVISMAISPALKVALPGPLPAVKLTGGIVIASGLDKSATGNVAGSGSPSMAVASAVCDDCVTSPEPSIVTAKLLTVTETEYRSSIRSANSPGGKRKEPLVWTSIFPPGADKSGVAVPEKEAAVG
jgi:hypothetical protein